MFGPVIDEVLRRRRVGASPAGPTGGPGQRTSLVCSVCSREIRPEERVFWVSNEAHCFQCHDMLEFEYKEERRQDADARHRGTKWDPKADD